MAVLLPTKGRAFPVFSTGLRSCFLPGYSPELVLAEAGRGAVPHRAASAMLRGPRYATAPGRLNTPTCSALPGAPRAFPTCRPEIAAGYGDRAVDPRFLPSRGVMGVALDVWVALQ